MINDTKSIKIQEKWNTQGKIRLHNRWGGGRIEYIFNIKNITFSIHLITQYIFVVKHV